MSETASPLSLLLQAQSIVDQLYRLTVDLSFTGEDEQEDNEIAAYAEMVEARAPLVEQMAVLQTQLTPADRTTPEYAEIMRTIADIADLDSTHRNFFEQLRDEVKDSLKGIKQGQKIHSAYSMEGSFDDHARINKKN